MSREIPIFFSTDDNYIPYLDVAIASLITNASRNDTYRIIVLNTGLKPENIAKVKMNGREGFSIEFLDISEYVEHIKSHFKNVYHFSIASYYRLFIASLFPQYDKIVYLDCDLIVLGDISELYHVELGNNILGAVCDQYVPYTLEFRDYVKTALGLNPDKYVNTGVLVINLNEFRKNSIEEQFIELITRYDFDLLDPDQAYLNFLCQDKICTLPNRWNKVPTSLNCEGTKSIVHYALYKKPWQDDDVVDGDFFWEYARNSRFYQQILEHKSAFGDEEKVKKEAATNEILTHAKKIVASDYTFSKLLYRGNQYGKINLQIRSTQENC
ncbi:MAG: glycosyltransferase family 8 protein [Lachnospiraceae bacterium]|nr:glycosyltransferase family 8 protein [Lachnospiraceae bacterium]